MKPKRKNLSNNNIIKNNNVLFKTNKNLNYGENRFNNNNNNDIHIIDINMNNNNDNKNNINKENNKLNMNNQKYLKFLPETNTNGKITPIKNKNKNIYFKKGNKKDLEIKNKINYNDFENTNSFIQSDIDEIRSIFDPNDLKNNFINENYIDTSKLFENSEDMKKEVITINDLDPKIKDVLILFVLSSNYYELLVQERAKKAFNFSKKKK